jgi:hypothetical protein
VTKKWDDPQKECQDVTTLQLTANDHLASGTTPCTSNTDLATSNPIVVIVWCPCILKTVP